jgi:hypothetical protein
MKLIRLLQFEFINSVNLLVRHTIRYIRTIIYSMVKRLIHRKFNCLDGQFNDVTIVSPPHTDYVAKMLKFFLEEIGVNVRLSDHNSKHFDSGLYILICPQVLKSFPRRYIAFQMEQSISTRWFNRAYFNILKNAEVVLDYNQTNLLFFLNRSPDKLNIFYTPIGFLPSYRDVTTAGKEFDILFYGDTNNERRLLFLNRLRSSFSVKIITNVFGEELYKEIDKARVVVNIHYYEDALLETTRIFECLSLGAIVISEKSSDQKEYLELESLVTFIEINDIEAMVNAVQKSLDNPQRPDIKDLEKTTIKSRNLFYQMLIKNDLFSCNNKIENHSFRSK